MHVGVPLAAVLSVITIVYFFTRVFGVAIRFPLLFVCGFMGLFLGLMLPKFLLPKLSLLGTILIVAFAMIVLSVFLAWLFARKETYMQEEESSEENNHGLLLATQAVDKVEVELDEQAGLQTQAIVEQEVASDDKNLQNINKETVTEEIVATTAVIMENQPTVSQHLPDNETQAWDNTEFDPASILSGALQQVQYETMATGERSYRLPEKTKPIFNRKTRKSSYKHSFMEKKQTDFDLPTVNNPGEAVVIAKKENAAYDKQLTVIIASDRQVSVKETDINSINELTKVNTENAKQAVNADEAIVTEKESPVAVQEGNFEPSVEKSVEVSELSQAQLQEKNIAAEQGNLVSFPVVEKLYEQTRQQSNLEFSSNKVIDFSTRLAQRSEQAVQNNESEIYDLEQAFTKQSLENESVSLNKEQTSQDNLHVASNLDKQETTVQLVTNDHYAAKNEAEAAQLNEKTVAFEIKERESSVNYQHCDDADLPYYREILSSNARPANKTALEKQMNSNLQPKQMPKSDSFEDLLDFAFTQKQRANYVDALHVFQMAYEMYAHTDDAVYIIAELVDVYKRQGEYDKAIAVLQEGRINAKLPQMRKDFSANINYLKIIKNILAANHLELLPYDEIPVKVKEDIENEFNQWKMSS